MARAAGGILAAVTGKEAYAAMLKDVVSPGLRRLGFTGSGGRYLWPSDTHWAQIGFQKSMYGTEDAVSFTLNVSVVTKDEWDQIRASFGGGKRPGPTLDYMTPGFYWKRVGMLLPQPGDVWWNVDGQTDVTRLGADLVKLAETYAVPEIAARIRPVGP